MDEFLTKQVTELREVVFSLRKQNQWQRNAFLFRESNRDILLIEISRLMDAILEDGCVGDHKEEIEYLQESIKTLDEKSDMMRRFKWNPKQ